MVTSSARGGVGHLVSDEAAAAFAVDQFQAHTVQYIAPLPLPLLPPSTTNAAHPLGCLRLELFPNLLFPPQCAHSAPSDHLHLQLARLAMSAKHMLSRSASSGQSATRKHIGR
jgi:hypothetical protein